MEELLSRHRKELRDLQSRITQKKKSATKKTRRGVNDECERLERELREKHRLEIGGLEGGDTVNGENGDREEEVDLDKLRIDDDEEEKVSKESVVTKDEAESTATAKPTTTEPQNETPTGKSKKPNRQKARLARRAAEVAEQSLQASLEASQLPDTRALEQERMNRKLSSLGLTENQIRSDGHCMYSAVAWAISLSPSPSSQNPTYQTIRSNTASYISSHPEAYLPFLSDPSESLESYTNKIANTAEWGGELELSAIANWSGRKIHVVQAEGIDRVFEPEFATPGKIPQGHIPRNHNDNPEGNENTDIWLAYYRKSFGLGEHYNALSSTSTSSTSSSSRKRRGDGKVN
ncbi:putative otu domain-containing protein 6b [Phaeomoniella chlamydospora]|uniref:Putative otu domain-containing protein 6b n=1 Tax=Phaeomoniella chlamydospora TaxID=158046 RepID=A0A0G2G3M4_PHACM|nr:putative otu domain-containing protein 6b [Phaeomoniella chlamydospora]